MRRHRRARAARWRSFLRRTLRQPDRPRRSPAAGLRMKLEQRCQTIELMLSDVDGVLTDGEIIFNNQGIETKQFHIRDGMGIKLWQRAGYKFGLITGRSSHIVKIRAAELGIEIVRQTAEDKLPVAQEILQQLGPGAAAGLLHRRRPARSAGDARRGPGRGRGRRLRRSARGGPLRDRAARRRGRGSRNDRGDSQGPAPLERSDPKIHQLSGRWPLAAAPPSRCRRSAADSLVATVAHRPGRRQLRRRAGRLLALLADRGAADRAQRRAEGRRTARDRGASRRGARSDVSARQRDVAQYFPTDAWELRQSGDLGERSDPAAVQDHRRPCPTARSNFTPCTLLFFPRAAPAAPSSRSSCGPSKGADRQVRPADRAQERRPVEARIGRRPPDRRRSRFTATPATPGADDDLQITTRDVEMLKDRIWTPHPVQFRLGRNHGSGRDMEIQLGADEETSRPAAGFGPARCARCN